MWCYCGCVRNNLCIICVEDTNGFNFFVHTIVKECMIRLSCLVKKKEKKCITRKKAKLNDGKCDSFKKGLPIC